MYSCYVSLHLSQQYTYIGDYFSKAFLDVFNRMGPLRLPAIASLAFAPTHCYPLISQYLSNGYSDSPSEPI